MVQMSRGQSTAAASSSSSAQGQGQKVSRQVNQEIVQNLTQVLGETYSLAFQTQICRWNIVGPTFYTLHSRLGNQYRALTRAANRIGNRIRAINPEAQVNFGQFSNLQQVTEQQNAPAAWQEIIQQLQNAHQQLVQRCETAIETAQSSQDSATVYLLLRRASYHEKTASKLRNLLAAQNKQAANI